MANKVCMDVWVALLQPTITALWPGCRKKASLKKKKTKHSTYITNSSQNPPCYQHSPPSLPWPSPTHAWQRSPPIILPSSHSNSSSQLSLFTDQDTASLPHPLSAALILTISSSNISLLRSQINFIAGLWTSCADWGRSSKLFTCSAHRKQTSCFPLVFLNWRKHFQKQIYREGVVVSTSIVWLTCILKIKKTNSRWRHRWDLYCQIYGLLD